MFINAQRVSPEGDVLVNINSCSEAILVLPHDSRKSSQHSGETRERIEFTVSVQRLGEKNKPKHLFIHDLVFILMVTCSVSCSAFP